MKRYRLVIKDIETEAMDEDEAIEDTVSEILMGNFDIVDVIDLDDDDIWN